MATTEPQKWAATLGNTADVNAIPATTPSGSGRASFSGLFPPVTQLPLDQGGIAPERGDFNALFKYLGEYIYYAMQGGVYTYVTTYNYTAGNFVLHEGSLYLCIAANGPGSVIKYPTDTAYWRRLALMSDIPAIPTVGNGKITVQASGTSIGSFTVNQGGNSTINIPGATVNAFGVVKADELGAYNGTQGWAFAAAYKSFGVPVPTVFRLHFCVRSTLRRLFRLCAQIPRGPGRRLAHSLAFRRPLTQV